MSKHLTHWRIKAIEDIAETKSRHTHYSTVSSISKKDMEEFRVTLAKLIQDYSTMVRFSKEELLCGFNLDFFKLF